MFQCENLLMNNAECTKWREAYVEKTDNVDWGRCEMFPQHSHYQKYCRATPKKSMYKPNYAHIFCAVWSDCSSAQSTFIISSTNAEINERCWLQHGQGQFPHKSQFMCDYVMFPTSEDWGWSWVRCCVTSSALLSVTLVHHCPLIKSALKANVKVVYLQRQRLLLQIFSENTVLPKKPKTKKNYFFIFYSQGTRHWGNLLKAVLSNI